MHFNSVAASTVWTVLQSLKKVPKTHRNFFFVSFLAFGLLLISTTMNPAVTSQDSVADPGVAQASQYLQEGHKLNSNQVKEMEANLKADPRDLPDRLRLIGYHLGQQSPGAGFLKGKVQHFSSD